VFGSLAALGDIMVGEGSQYIIACFVVWFSVRLLLLVGVLIPFG
jgi:hypothetical protein